MKEKRPFQSPIEITQLELEGMKAGEKKVLKAVNKRIKDTVYRDETDKSSIPDEQRNEKDTPVALSKKDLAILKMGGKMPERLIKKTESRNGAIKERDIYADKKNILKSSPDSSPPKK